MIIICYTNFGDLMKKIVCLLVIFLTITILFTSCDKLENSTNKNEIIIEKFSKTTIDSGFNTFLNVIGYCENETEFLEYFNIAVNDFKIYNKLFDIYNNYEGINNIKTINDNAGIKAVIVDPSIIEMLDLAKEFSDLSNNEFDVTYGAVLKIWHKYREAGISYNNDGEYGPIPELSLLETAEVDTGWQFVEIDHENNSVFITNPNTSLDVGSIAKGFTSEKVSNHLEELGLLYGVVNAGGNNRTINGKPDGSGYTVGVQNPNGETPTLLSVVSPSESCSFVTSGDYQNYYIGTNKKTYHHIINPETLYPATYFNSVSIICKDSGIADAFSTTLFTLSYNQGSKLIEQYNKINPDNTIEVIWVMDIDKQFETQNSLTAQNYFVVYTDGLKESIKTY
jgi:thiamine biosynthesis lipoprotein